MTPPGFTVGVGLLFTPVVFRAPGVAPMVPIHHPGQQLGLGVGLVVTPGLVGVVTVVMALMWWANNRRHPARGLSPEKVVSYRGPEEGPKSPEALCRLITERLEQIRRTLLRNSLSEVEVEMCMLGCQACAEDTALLVRMVEEELHRAGTIVRWLRLKMARRKAKVCLSRVHGILSQKNLLLTRQKQS